MLVIDAFKMVSCEIDQIYKNINLDSDLKDITVEKAELFLNAISCFKKQLIESHENVLSQKVSFKVDLAEALYVSIAHEVALAILTNLSDKVVAKSHELASSNHLTLLDLPPDVLQAITSHIGLHTSLNLVSKKFSERIQDTSYNLDVLIELVCKDDPRASIWLNQRPITASQVHHSTMLVTHGDRLLEHAIEHDYVELLEVLLTSKKIDPTVNGNQVLKWAAKNGYVAIMKLLLADERINPAIENNIIIQKAAKNGCVDIVRLLLADKRVDPADDGGAAFQWAAEKGNIEVVKLLLKDGRVDPANTENYALRWAAFNGHVKVVELLLNDRRVTPAANSNQALQWASQNGHAMIVKLLTDPRPILNDSKKRNQINELSLQTKMQRRF